MHPPNAPQVFRCGTTACVDGNNLPTGYQSIPVCSTAACALTPSEPTSYPVFKDDADWYVSRFSYNIANAWSTGLDTFYFARW